MPGARAGLTQAFRDRSRDDELSIDLEGERSEHRDFESPNRSSV